MSADGLPACPAPAGPQAQPPEDDRVGPGSGACGIPARGSDAPAPGRGDVGAGGPNLRPPLPIAVERPSRHPEGQVHAHVRGRGGPGGHLEGSCAHAVLPGARKSPVRPQHPPYQPHGGLRGGHHCDLAGNLGCCGGHACFRCDVCASHSEGGCGVASRSDVAPVARLAGFMQFLARAEPLLGCYRQLVVPPATEAGLLDALNALCPPP